MRIGDVVYPSGRKSCSLQHCQSVAVLRCIALRQLPQIPAGLTHHCAGSLLRKQRSSGQSAACVLLRVVCSVGDAGGFARVL